MNRFCFVIYILSFFILLACRNNLQENKKNPNSTFTENNKKRDNIIPLICKLYQNFDKTTPIYINKHSSEIIESINGNVRNEECIFQLIDTLVFVSIQNTSSSEYIVAIDSLASKSDGFLSEYLGEVGRKLFYKDFDQLIRYVTQYPKSHLILYIKDGLSMMLSDFDAEERKKMTEGLHDLVLQKLNKGNFNEDQKLFAKSIINNLYPEKFD